MADTDVEGAPPKWYEVATSDPMVKSEDMWKLLDPSSTFRWMSAGYAGPDPRAPQQRAGPVHNMAKSSISAKWQRSFRTENDEKPRPQARGLIIVSPMEKSQKIPKTQFIHFYPKISQGSWWIVAESEYWWILHGPTVMHLISPIVSSKRAAWECEAQDLSIAPSKEITPRTPLDHWIMMDHDVFTCQPFSHWQVTRWGNRGRRFSWNSLWIPPTFPSFAKYWDKIGIPAVSCVPPVTQEDHWHTAEKQTNWVFLENQLGLMSLCAVISITFEQCWLSFAKKWSDKRSVASIHWWEQLRSYLDVHLT